MVLCAQICLWRLFESKAQAGRWAGRISRCAAWVCCGGGAAVVVVLCCGVNCWLVGQRLRPLGHPQVRCWWGMAGGAGVVGSVLLLGAVVSSSAHPGAGPGAAAACSWHHTLCPRLARAVMAFCRQPPSEPLLLPALETILPRHALPCPLQLARAVMDLLTAFDRFGFWPDITEGLLVLAEQRPAGFTEPEKAWLAGCVAKVEGLAGGLPYYRWGLCFAVLHADSVAVLVVVACSCAQLGCGPGGRAGPLPVRPL